MVTLSRHQRNSMRAHLLLEKQSDNASPLTQDSSPATKSLRQVQYWVATWISPPLPRLVTRRNSSMKLPSQLMAITWAPTTLLTTLLMVSAWSGLAVSLWQTQLLQLAVLARQSTMWIATDSRLTSLINLQIITDSQRTPPRMESPLCGESRMESLRDSREELRPQTPPCLMITLLLGLVLSVDLHPLELLLPWLLSAPSEIAIKQVWCFINITTR